MTLDSAPRIVDGCAMTSSLPDRGDAEAILNRDALQLPTPFAAPQGASEAIIADVFGQVMQVRPVGRDDRFADLGGDSFMALQVMLVLENAHFFAFDSAMLETHDTPAAIAALLGS
jgi:acyl carrier protein